MEDLLDLLGNRPLLVPGNAPKNATENSRRLVHGGGGPEHFRQVPPRANLHPGARRPPLGPEAPQGASTSSAAGKNWRGAWQRASVEATPPASSPPKTGLSRRRIYRPLHSATPIKAAATPVRLAICCARPPAVRNHKSNCFLSRLLRRRLLLSSLGGGLLLLRFLAWLAEPQRNAVLALGHWPAPWPLTHGFLVGVALVVGLSRIQRRSATALVMPRGDQDPGRDRQRLRSTSG